jgi:hypothetical protein
MHGAMGSKFDSKLIPKWRAALPQVLVKTWKRRLTNADVVTRVLFSGCKIRRENLWLVANTPI